MKQIAMLYNRICLDLYVNKIIKKRERYSRLVHKIVDQKLDINTLI